MKPVASCIICSVGSAQFRCRYCRSMYCSSRCFKEHREGFGPGGCTHAPQQLKNTDTGDGPKPDSLNNSQPATGTEALITPGTSVDGLVGQDSYTGTQGSDESLIYGRRDEDGSLVVLGQAHLAALAQDSQLRGQLRSAELQQLLRIINISRSRVDALEAALANVPEFKAFCDRVLQVVGRANLELRPRV